MTDDAVIALYVSSASTTTVPSPLLNPPYQVACTRHPYIINEPHTPDTCTVLVHMNSEGSC